MTRSFKLQSALFALVLTGGLGAAWLSPYRAVPDSIQCSDDYGCDDGRPWDCHTMGNRICGTEIGDAYGPVGR